PLRRRVGIPSCAITGAKATASGAGPITPSLSISHPFTRHITRKNLRSGTQTRARTRLSTTKIGRLRILKAKSAADRKKGIQTPVGGILVASWLRVGCGSNAHRLRFWRLSITHAGHIFCAYNCAKIATADKNDVLVTRHACNLLAYKLALAKTANWVARRPFTD
ncbi:MAG: hypothetical protein KGQ42_05615, partial [Alphaproteobacteria bacterium]|nr:hypothetical protein [Alphaproteobacteria bacterium]